MAAKEHVGVQMPVSMKKQARKIAEAKEMGLSEWIRTLVEREITKASRRSSTTKTP